MLNDISVSKDERTNAALAHGSILLFLANRPLGLLVAFLVWVTQRGKSRFAARHAIQALVYQLLGLVVVIAVWAGWAVLLAGSAILPALVQPHNPEALSPYTMIPAVLLIVVPFAVMMAWIGYGVYAAVRVWRGHDFSYPMIGGWVK